MPNSPKGRSTLAAMALLFLPILIGGCQDFPHQADNRPELEILSPATHGDLQAFLAALDYDWNTLEAGVPPFILENLPADFSRTPSSERKRLFFLSILPMVLMVNEEIASQREWLLTTLEAHDQGELLGTAQLLSITELAREYRVDGDPLVDRTVRLSLLSRLDVIPPSLALAQAASESGYGTSRFARLGNNFFGEWTFTPGAGIVPQQRPAGETYEVRRFDSVYDSVRSYMKNLNTNKAYRSFRLQRAQLRSQGRPLLGQELAAGLTQYSVRGEEYVSEIQAIIRRNRLSLLASVNLRPTSTAREPLKAGLLSTRSLPQHLASRDVPVKN
ncbi:MAG: glucosaminidase domain-containing protein [Desulfuromonadales bacterium]|nr:glucosaminidase domain-containing protein [Desulfuromonadales bacterium]